MSLKVNRFNNNVWIKKIQYIYVHTHTHTHTHIHIMQYYSAIKKNEFMSFAGTGWI
jgi:hypothetical protein